jgi:3-oxo-5alpha-steroid 4-dehydrogenase
MSAPVTAGIEPRVVDDPEAVAWDHDADVVIVGMGAAGACAAIEARDAGASVLVLERFTGGGATRLSGGVVYAGGGTSIQHEAGVVDDVDALYGYLSQEVGDAVSPEALRAFCADSVGTIAWLQAQGVPFEGSLCPVKTSYPIDRWYLYFSGNELLAPYADRARPAPRGHRAKGPGLPGAALFDPLLRRAVDLGVDVRAWSRVTRLVVGGGRVVGVEGTRLAGLAGACAAALMRAATALRVTAPGVARRLIAQVRGIERRFGVPFTARARGGVVLAAGGFIFERDMVKAYAPAYRRGMPLGAAGDDGVGIRLGQGVGGALSRMGRVSAWRFINPPEAWTRGVLVDRDGQRYVNELAYGATIGDVMVEERGGVGFLVLDHAMVTASRGQLGPEHAQWFQSVPARINLWANCPSAPTIEALAARVEVSPDGLRRTVDAYHAACATGHDPLGKPSSHLVRLEHPPFYAIDCSIGSRRFPLPTLTLGGLRVDERTAAVQRADGSSVPGLFAAGRTAAGVCSERYVSGLSIADCVASGRRSGRSAATTEGT